MAEAQTAQPSTAEPVESIEVGDVKQEDAVEEKSDNEGDAVDENAGDDRAVSNEQYRALRNITEVLTNHTIKIKGDEYVPYASGIILS